MNLEQLQTALNNASQALEAAQQRIQELEKRNATQQKVIDQYKAEFKRERYQRLANKRRSF
jgi:uncharacterized coiled-coil protein SlyX